MNGWQRYCQPFYFCGKISSAAFGRAAPGMKDRHRRRFEDGARR
jgi:hypothetical protein